MSDILKIDIKINRSKDNKSLLVELGEYGKAVLDLPPESDWWTMHQAIKDLLDLDLRYESPIELTHKEEIETIKPFLKKEYSSFSISPKLPKGLSFDEKTGEITGTPAESITDTEFKVSADSDVFAFTVAVVEPAPSNLIYKVPTMESETEVYIKPSYKGDVDYFLIDKDLPVGMKFNEETGEITGSTKELMESRSYTVIAQNKFGGTSVNFVLKILNSKPQFSYETPFYTAQRDRLFDAYPHILGPIENFTVSPDLPEGLVFCKDTGRIKGMVKKLSPIKYKPDEYTVTAHNGEQTYSQNISILRVIPAPKKLKYDPIINIALRERIEPILPLAVEGDPHTLRYCAWLPEGLEMDVMTGAIIGIPLESGSHEIKVVVSNSTGTAQFTFLLNID